MQPTIGRIITYRTTEMERNHLKSLSQSGVSTNVSEELPAIIVAVWNENLINAKVLTDGFGPDLWKTSIKLGDQEGNWFWPARV